MKSEKQIKDLLEQYEYDKEMHKLYFPHEKIANSRCELIIQVLRWVLDNEN